MCNIDPDCSRLPENLKSFSTIGEMGYSQNIKETHSSLYKTLMVDCSLENSLKISFSSLPNKARKTKRRRGQKPVTTTKEFCQIKEVICRVKPQSEGHSPMPQGDSQGKEIS